MKGHFAFFSRSVDDDIVVQDTATSTIMLMSTGDSLNDTFRVPDPCDRGCLFVIILVDKFEDQESFLDDTYVLAKTLWKRRVSAVAVLGSVAGSVAVAGSTSFQPYRYCTISPPVILDRCEGNDWKNLKTIDFPDLNNCDLMIAYFDNPPYVVSLKESVRLNGFEGTLIEEVSKQYQLIRQRAEWSLNTSYAEQVKLLIFDDTMADLVVGGLLQQSEPDVEYSTTYDILKVVWIVPKIPKVSLEGLVQPFHPFVWAAIGGTLLLGGSIKSFLMPDVSWLEIFALLIGVAFYRQPTRLSRRIHFISWSIFGLFLTQLYVDSLADQLINVSDLKIETMKDLIASSFSIGGTGALVELFDDFEETDEIMEQIRENFVTFDQDTYNEQLGDLLVGKNTTFALVAVLNSSRTKAVETTYAYTMTSDVICSYPLAVATWKGFPQLRTINARIQNFIDFGVFDFMIGLALSNDTRAKKFAIAQNEEYKSNLHLQQFVPAFLLMVIGFSSGFLFLFLEILVFPWRVLG
ncbi:hypothetical protein WN55_03995 [Dufourea novaeangliae]|uniref:Ionotropic glutamate receptor C-terminal domain-containing protein n=1 Tax=Dufourea novaeangliae TaxID=178035 RepID=A0A154PL31_DUFNO|nr:hypothetical protein WN55_03995 [Dufourea novaeangliae]